MAKGLIFDVSDGSTEYVKCIVCGEVFSPLKTKKCGVLERYSPNEELSFCSNCIDKVIDAINKLSLQGSE